MSNGEFSIGDRSGKTFSVFSSNSVYGSLYLHIFVQAFLLSSSNANDTSHYCCASINSEKPVHTVTVALILCVR